MLQVSYIRQNRDTVLERLAVKNFTQVQLVDEVITLDDERKKLQADFDNTQARVNTALKEEVASLKTNIEPLKSQMAEVEKKLLDKLLLIPNLPASNVPKGKTPEDN